MLKNGFESKNFEIFEKVWWWHDLVKKCLFSIYIQMWFDAQLDQKKSLTVSIWGTLLVLYVMVVVHNEVLNKFWWVQYSKLNILFINYKIIIEKSKWILCQSFQSIV